ncbi:hypothetical protein M8J77_012479 [Diaphorina citri]|jgi:hypothetical protein|nr:hypothetical protein M8J77_012479 [Diaphorina citri]
MENEGKLKEQSEKKEEEEEQVKEESNQRKGDLGKTRIEEKVETEGQEELDKTKRGEKGEGKINRMS